VDGAFLFHSPTGKLLAAVPPREHMENILAWPREWAEENDLDIGPEVNLPQWDGSKPDYDIAVSGLLSAG